MLSTHFSNRLSVKALLLWLCLMLGTSSAYALEDFSELVQRVTPGVVRVTVIKEVKSGFDQEIPEVFRRFFGDQLPAPQARLQTAYGSAFFMTSDGYLITNHHVVASADKITITLNDRRELDAKLIGSDERTDVAVLKVEGSGFPALPVGNSDLLKVGQPVLAIGSPFGFDYTASAGIVSATARSISNETAVPFVQTDVALNPGNSGGPLFNNLGQVVAVNSRIFSGTGGYMGLSFSIPINLAVSVYEQLKSGGEVRRAYLGVFPQDIDRNLAEVYGLPRPQGALITKVSEKGAADKAGIKAGDIILTFNGRNVERAADLINLINASKVGERFTASIKRDKRMINLSGTLELAPDLTEKSTEQMQKDNGASIGIKIRQLSEPEAQSIGTKGMLITQVDPLGLAARAGLQRGDVITDLNGARVPDVSSFAKAADALPKQGVVEVRILRDQVPYIVGLRLS